VKQEPIRQVLTDVERNVRVEHWSISSDEVDPAAKALGESRKTSCTAGAGRR
jgi:hypothetical protein